MTEHCSVTTVIAALVYRVIDKGLIFRYIDSSLAVHSHHYNRRETWILTSALPDLLREKKWGHTQNMVLLMVKFPTMQVVAHGILARVAEKSHKRTNRTPTLKEKKVRTEP